jgi:hypothetical protein
MDEFHYATLTNKKKTRKIKIIICGIKEQSRLNYNNQCIDLPFCHSVAIGKNDVEQALTIKVEFVLDHTVHING